MSAFANRDRGKLVYLGAVVPVLRNADCGERGLPHAEEQDGGGNCGCFGGRDVLGIVSRQRLLRDPGNNQEGRLEQSNQHERRYVRHPAQAAGNRLSRSNTPSPTRFAYLSTTIMIDALRE